MNTVLLDDVILGTEVKAEDRMNMLPKYFGAFMMQVEQTVFNCMTEISDDYDGGLWRFYVLNNGGFYMSPSMDEKLTISVEGNYFEGQMSADAAGITACLFAYSRVSFAPRASHIGEQYYLLRDYALTHPEASQILAAID